MLFHKRTDFSQKAILQKLSVYLNLFVSNATLAQQFKRGYCAGFTMLHLYAIWLSLNAPNQKNPTDDERWLTHTLSLISYWNGKDNLSIADKTDIERFIALIQFFQHPSAATLHLSFHQLNILFSDTKNRTANRVYSIGAHFTEKEFLKSLQQIVFDDQLVFIYTENHAMGLLKHGNQYYYIDPNYKKGLQHFSSLENCVHELYKHNHKNPHTPTSLGVVIFDLQNANTHQTTSHPFPPQADLLKNLSIFNPHATIRHPFYHHNMKAKAAFTPLMTAVDIGCAASVDFILQQANQQYLFNQKNKSGLSAADLAALHGNPVITEKLNTTVSQHNQLFIKK